MLLKQVFIGFWIASFLTTASAAEFLTLDGAMDEGLKRSPLIQKARAELENSSWKRAESLGAGFLPKVSLMGVKYLTTGYSVSIIPGFGNFPGFYPNTTFSAEISIPIFDGLANIANFQGSLLNEEASSKELSRTEFQLRKDIQLSFYQALAASQISIVAEENVKTLEDHLRQIKIKNEGGSATQYDVLRVVVQLSDANADAIDAKDSVILARKKLTQLMGLKEDERPLQGELPIPVAEAVKDLKETDITTARDDIQALNLRADAASKFRSAQAAWIYPTISLGGEYQFYDQQKVNFATSSVINTGSYQPAYNVGVFLKWNLFDGGVAIARANQASNQEIIAEKGAESAKIAVPYDFEYWKRRYISNTDHYRSKTFDISRSQESVRLAREEERAGSRTSTETLDAELDLFRAKAGVITSQVNAAEAKIRLELVLGRGI